MLTCLSGALSSMYRQEPTVRTCFSRTRIKVEAYGLLKT